MSKSIILSGNYILRSDLITMLERLILEIEVSQNLDFILITSNLGGELNADFYNDELPNLRQYHDKPRT